MARGAVVRKQDDRMLSSIALKLVEDDRISNRNDIVTDPNPNPNWIDIVTNL